MNMDRKRQLYRLLSLEYNCGPEAFDREDNVLTESKLRDGRRRYAGERYFFHMATLGSNAVITADPCLHPFLREYMRDKAGYRLFEVPHLLQLEGELNRFSHTLTQTYHMFLPAQRVEVRRSDPVVWYSGEEIWPFYGDDRFPNAIAERFLPERPDRLAAVAYDGDEIMAMAGCSEDAPGWMQIGIDVLPRYRNRGIGTYLVTLLKNRIEEMGAVPFYGTGVTNYPSWNTALNSGFRPVWVEIGSKPVKRQRPRCCCRAPYL